MKVLLTGATGFIGKHLQRELKNHNHIVLNLKSNLLKKDELEAEILNSDFDHVIHLAGLSHLTSFSPSQLYETNVIGSENLISSLEKKGDGINILLASSGHVYAPSEAFLSEESKVQPMSHYASSKLAMEYICNSMIEKNKLIILRIFNCTGPGQDPSFFIPKVLQSFVNKEKSLDVGNLEVEREFNSVHWLVAIIRNLTEENTPAGVYNICSGKTYRLENILSIISNITSHSLKINICQKIVRKNEQKKIAGNPLKLNKFLKKKRKVIKEPSIGVTIKQMIELINKK